MRLALIALLATAAAAQSVPRALFSHTKESLRGISAVSRFVAWASGSHGTYLRTTDGGRTWVPAQVPGAGALDFRAVVAFSADEAFLMSAGPGEQSRVYHTADGGSHWQLQFTNSDPKGFFDAMAFWDSRHGIVLGDPVREESGKFRFGLLVTDDGETWHSLPASQRPEAMEGENAFAASNSCIATLRRSTGVNEPAAKEAADPNLWFATGGTAARVFHSPDRGRTWEVFDTPIQHGRDSTGIFSIAFRNSLEGVIAGGDFKHPLDDGPNLAFTHDGGRTWELSGLHPQEYYSAVAYDRVVNDAAYHEQKQQQTEEKHGKKILIKPDPPERLFLVGQDLVFDFRPPNNPRGIGGPNKKGEFNAVSAFPEGGALVVGSKGTIAWIP